MANLFSLEGKVALVTGAAYGIGFAIAEALANAGAKIAFNCRGQEHLEKALGIEHYIPYHFGGILIKMICVWLLKIAVYKTARKP